MEFFRYSNSEIENICCDALERPELNNIRKFRFFKENEKGFFVPSENGIPYNEVPPGKLDIKGPLTKVSLFIFVCF